MGAGVILACGCAPSAKRDDGTPSCPIHFETRVAPTPDLTGRVARCGYGCAERPSSFDLAFFEYRGPGSPNATDSCVCGYYRVAHERDPNRRNPDPIVCKVGGFTPVGDKPDLYYCGCRGWD